MVNSIIIVNNMKPIQPGHSPIHLTTSLSTLSSDLSGVHQYKISVSVCSVCLQNSSDCSQMRTMFADKQKSTVQDIQLNPVQINPVGYLSFRDLCSYSTLVLGDHLDFPCRCSYRTFVTKLRTFPIMESKC